MAEMHPADIENYNYIEAIEYAKTLVDSIDKVSVGGIAATMLPKQIYEETGIMPVCGLLNEPGKLGLPGDECIDQIVPDYSMLDDVDYVYPCSRSFFEADFGKSSDEFVRYLSMPERLIASRGKISTTSRGKSKETEEEFEIRKAGWERDQKKIKIWNDLYDQLGDEKESFVTLIGDNEYLPEKVFGITSSLQKKLYLLYLTTPRLFSLLGLIDKKSSTYDLAYGFITIECPQLYLDLLDLLTDSESQQKYVFTNFINFFGKKGIQDLMVKLEKVDYAVDKQLAKWDIVCKKSGVEYIDYELIRVYRRYIDLKVLEDSKHEKAKNAIKELKMVELAQIMYDSIDDFEQKLLKAIDSEQGERLLSKVTKSIYDNIQLKGSFFYGKSNCSRFWCSVSFCICLVKECHALQIDFSYFQHNRKQCLYTFFVANFK